MKKLRPDLMVSDVNKTIKYFKELFDAQVIVTVPEDGILDFAIIKMGEVEIMIEVRKTLSEGVESLKEIPIGGSFTLFIDVDDVQILYDKVKNKVTIVKDMHETFYGTKEFYMQDMNGYIWTFAETKKD